MLPQKAQSRTREIRRPERRGVSRRRVIDAAKELVHIVDLVERLGPGQLRRVGDRLVGRCPLTDHDDGTPSFTVYPGSNSWFCYGCSRGGDVIELARFAWNYDKSAAPMAAANLLDEFGHSIPSQPDAWHRKQSRQKSAREALEKAKIQRARRLIYRLLFARMVESIPDEDVRREEARYAWRDAGLIAEALIRGGAE